ncbi:hypothetical protein ISCGN_011742 [Ixodes scapularis]
MSSNTPPTSSFSPAAALSVDGNLEEMDTRPASQASPAAAATDQLTTSLIAPAKRTAEEKPFLESSPNKPSKGKKKKSDKTNPLTANSSPNSASVAMPEATTPAQETPITAASRRQDADTTALMIFTAGCAQDGAAATEWQGSLPSDDEKWTPVTYKRRKRVRVDPSLQAHGAVRPRQRLFEYKVRPTNSQVSIKPYLQPLKTQCTMLRTTASFSMHLIDQANTISVRTDTEELAKMLSEITEIKVQGREALPVQVFRTFGTSYTKCIIYDIYPKEQDPRDEVLNHELESEKVDIVAARRLGKSNTAVITFDGERIPRSIFYGKRYMRVFPHKHKAVTCRNCHRLGHKPDICPNQAVCPTCGTSHLADTDPAKGPGCPDSTPYCQGCKKKGHLGTDRKCPTWSATNKRMREDIQKLKKQHRLQQPSENTERVKNTTKTQSGTLWADKVKQNIQVPPPAPTGGSETQELRNMCSYLKAELDRLKATVHPKYFPSRVSKICSVVVVLVATSAASLPENIKMPCTKPVVLRKSRSSVAPTQAAVRRTMLELMEARLRDVEVGIVAAFETMHSDAQAICEKSTTYINEIILDFEHTGLLDKNFLEVMGEKVALVSDLQQGGRLSHPPLLPRHCQGGSRRRDDTSATSLGGDQDHFCRVR